MAPFPSDPNASTGTGSASTQPRMPRWVKVFGIIGIIVVLFVVAVAGANLAGLEIAHGPGRHRGNPAELTESLPDPTGTPTSSPAGPSHDVPTAFWNLAWS